MALACPFFTDQEGVSDWEIALDLFQKEEEKNWENPSLFCHGNCNSLLESNRMALLDHNSCQTEDQPSENVEWKSDIGYTNNKEKSPQLTSYSKIAKYPLFMKLARATLGFVLSEAARPHCCKILSSHGLSFPQFGDFILSHRIRAGKSVKQFLLFVRPNETDTQDVCLKKKMLVQLIRLFVQDFSINWIFSSDNKKWTTIQSRTKLLSYRKKFLQRILIKECM